jgi:hypothetical protein
MVLPADHFETALTNVAFHQLEATHL